MKFGTKREIAAWMGHKLYRVSAGVIWPLHMERQISSLMAKS